MADKATELLKKIIDFEISDELCDKHSYVPGAEGGSWQSTELGEVLDEAKKLLGIEDRPGATVEEIMQYCEQLHIKMDEHAASLKAYHLKRQYAERNKS